MPPNLALLFDFVDHNAPKFSMIREFCAHMHEWLRADVKNVAAVHCKAGKGRTGTMICCYLLYCGAMGTAADVLEFYGVRRTYNGHGVTIPSQRRYVQYFAESLQPSFDASRERTTWSLKRIFISHVPLNEHGEVLAEWKPLLGVTRKDKTLLYVGALGANAASCVPSFQCDGLTIQGDVKFELFNGKSTKRLLWFWLNTAFIPPGKKSLTLYKQDLDGICKDKEHKIVPADFSVTVFFEKVSGRARTQRGSKAPPPNPSIISSNHDNAPNSSRSGSLGQPNTSIGARSISPAPNGSPKRQGSFSITSASKSAIRALSPSRKRKAEEKEFFQTSNAASASESTSPTRSHPVNISNRDNENENELGPSSPSSDGGKNESKNSEENSLPHMPPPPSIDPRSFAAAARAHNEAIERPTSPQQADGEKEKPIWTPADYQHRANQGSSSSHGSSISIHEHASHSTQHNASIPETSSQSSKSLQFSSLHQLMGDGSSTSSETSSLPSHSSAGEVNLVVSEFNSSQSLCDICGLVLGSSDTVHVGGKMLHWACATCSVCAEPLANRGSVTIRETTTVDAALICSNCDTFWVRCPHCKRPVQDGNTLRTVPQLDGNKRCDACFCCSICQTSFAPDDDEDVDEDDWKDTFDIIGGAMICKSHSMASRKIFVSKKASTATNDKKNIGEIVSANEKDDINDKSERNASEKRPRSGRIGAVGSGLATMNVSEPIHSQHASSSQISIDSSNIADSNMTSEDGKGQRNDSNEESSSDAANPTPNSSSQSHQDLTSVSGDINDAETKARPARPKREKIEPPSSSLQKLSLRRRTSHLPYFVNTVFLAFSTRQMNYED